MTIVDAHSLIVWRLVPDGQCLQKLVLFFDYLSSAYINGLWAAFGFVKAEGGLWS